MLFWKNSSITFDQSEFGVVVYELNAALTYSTVILFGDFVENTLPVSLADLLELGGNDTGEHRPDSASGDERFGDTSHPEVDVFRDAIELDEFPCQIWVIQHRPQFIDVTGGRQAAKPPPRIIA